MVLATALQKLPGDDIGADSPAAAARSRSVQLRGFQSLLEIGRQGIKGRVSRMQGRGQPAFGCDKGGVSLHPFCQGFAGFMLGGQNRRGVGAGVDFTAEDGRDELGALRKWR